MIFVFFVYGLAFFSMGLVVWLESGRTSGFRGVRVLRYLAGFGILHGLHEWVEIFTRLDSQGLITIPNLLLFHAVDAGLLNISFLLLIIFGFRMIYMYRSEDDRNGRKYTLISVAGFILIWSGITVFTLLYFRPYQVDFLTIIDVLSRYILGIPGAFLAAWALLLLRRAFQARGLVKCAKDLRWAAVSLVVYGAIGQLITEPSVLFPSTFVNADLFQQLFGLPVQIFRAAAATLIAVFVIRALRAFELERQQRLTIANEDRLAAQQAALATQHRAQVETEKLNRELQTAVQDLTMLFDLSSSLATTLELEILLQKTMDQVFDSVPRIEGGMIFLREKMERPLQQMVCVGYGAPNNDAIRDHAKCQAQAIGQYVVDASQPACWVNDIIVPLGNLNNKPGQETTKIHTFIVGIPLSVQEQITGSLVLGMNANAVPFSRHDLSLINTIASQLSMAITNATLYQEVQAREELRGEMLHQIVSAQEMERQRIARELHDGAGQMLTALGMGLAAASDSLTHNPSRGAQQLSELKTMNTKVMHELQNLVAGLRPSVLDDLGLVPAIRGLIKDFEGHKGLSAQFAARGHPRRLQPELEIVLFRITQEALTNVVKHAQADTVHVELTMRYQEIQLLIRDNGCGFNPDEVLHIDSRQRWGWGLLGIEERVALVGGDCHINSQPGLGTAIQVDIPIDKELLHAN